MESLRDKILAKLSNNDNLNFYCNTPLSALVNDVVCNAPLAYQPGTSFLYGLNTDVLGYLIEIISGKSLDVFFTEVHPSLLLTHSLDKSLLTKSFRKY